MPSKLNSLTQVIDSDEETSKTFNQLKFTEGVINGRIAVIESEEESVRRSKAKKAANKAIRSAGAAEKAIQKAQFKNFVNKANKKSRR